MTTTLGAITSPLQSGALLTTSNDAPVIVPDRTSDIIINTLSQDGLGVTLDAAVNAAGTNQYWELRPAPGQQLAIARLTASYRDNATFDAENYGGGSGPLTNGILMSKVTGTGLGATQDILFTDDPIKNNADWASYCFDTKVDDYGIGDKFITVRWSFYKSGSFLPLDGDLNEALRITLRDDFTFLLSQKFRVWGYVV